MIINIRLEYSISWDDLRSEECSIGKKCISLGGKYRNYIYDIYDDKVIFEIDSVAEIVDINSTNILVTRFFFRRVGALQIDFESSVVESNNPDENFVLFPNPSTNAVAIIFQMDQSDNVSIELFDLSGNYIDSIFNGLLEEGLQSINYSVSHLPIGTYYLKVN